MIYFCADDYGLCDAVSMRIQKCADEGILNKVSVFPNFDAVDFEKITANKDVAVSLHLNLVEGKCMADDLGVNVLTDEYGNFKNTFGGLFALSIFKRKKLYEAAYKELRAQISFWKKALPENMPFMVDGHQHTHMIPPIFNALIKALEDEKAEVKYLRIPSEPCSPFIKTPSLYFTYSAINLIKQWLLKFLAFVNKKQMKKYKIPTAYFFGVLFSGNMDEKRVNKILPKYIKLAEKKDIEILLHPGYIEKGEADFKGRNIAFDKFYFSRGRKCEFNTAMNIKVKEE